MSLTPLDLLHKEFKRSFRGLKEREVQEFLQQTANALEEALTSNAELRDKVQSLERRLLHYEKIEETMQNALVLAQKSAEDTRLGSQKQAEVILADAEQRRKQILEDARNRGAEIEREYADLKQQRKMFETEMRALLRAHLEALDRCPSGEEGETLPASADESAQAGAERPPADPEHLPEPERSAQESAPVGALDWTKLTLDDEPTRDESTPSSDSLFATSGLAAARTYGG